MLFKPETVGNSVIREFRELASAFVALLVATIVPASELAGVSELAEISDALCLVEGACVVELVVNVSVILHLVISVVDVDVVVCSVVVVEVLWVVLAVVVFSRMGSNSSFLTLGSYPILVMYVAM